jgi:sulfotransferase famil protein
MELSYSHRFIFIHVYRAAGQSISQAVKPYSADPARRLMRVPVARRLAARRIAKARVLWEHNYGHIKAKELKRALPPSVFDPFYKFAFVRNPWAWQVSVYHYVRQNRAHPDHERYSRFTSLEHYLDWRIHSEGAELQKDFVLGDSGELLVDFVGRYESLEEDFAYVCNRVGMACSLPHKNSSAHGDYRGYYTAHARALVAEAYREDIELFGYEFDEQERLPPILGRAETERLRA